MFTVQYDSRLKAWVARFWKFDLNFHNVMSKIRFDGCSERGNAVHELRLLVAFRDGDPNWLSIEQFQREYNFHRQTS